jgi:hypothetical protein
MAAHKNTIDILISLPKGHANNLDKEAKKRGKKRKVYIEEVLINHSLNCQVKEHV